MGILPPGSDISVFCAGLNNPKSRDFARQRAEEYQAQQRKPIDLWSLADKVQYYEHQLDNDSLLDQQAAAVARAGSSAAAGGYKGGRRGADENLLKVMLQSRRDNEATQQYFNRMGPSERLRVTMGYEMAAIDPKAPDAVCTECPTSKKPHLNNDCKGKRVSSALAMAAVQDSNAGSSSSKGNSSSAGGSSGAPTAVVDVNTLALMMQQAMAMAAAGAPTPAGLGQGLPRAYNKPEGSNKGGGRGRQQYQNSPGLVTGAAALACIICGFSKGHGDGVCYFDKPNEASPKWEGPTARAPEQGIIHYVARCMQLKIAPKLGRCRELLQRLAQSNKLPPQMLQYIQQHMQQRPMAMGYTAPAGHYAAAAYMAGMAPGMMSPWPMMGGMQGQQLAAGLPAVNSPLAIAGAPTPAAEGNAGGQAAMMALPTAVDAQELTGEDQGSSAHEYDALNFGPSYCFMNHANWQQFAFDGASSSAVADGQHALMVTATGQHNMVTRAQTGAGQVQPSRVLRQPTPKGFLPPAALPTDLNAMRIQPRNIVSEPLSSSLFGDRQLLTSLLDIQQLVNQKVDAIKGALGGAQVAEAAQRSGSSSSSAQPAKQQSTEATAAKGSASAAPSSSAGRCGPIAAAAAASRNLSELARLESLVLQLGFKPMKLDYAKRQSLPVTLDFLTGTSKLDGLTLTTPDGRDILVRGAFKDNGSTILLITEDACGRWGITIIRTTQVPSVTGIDGCPSRQIIGRTGPLVITLAKGHPLAAVLPVPCAYVIKGDAGGMFSMCLDKKTLLPVYGFVDPAVNMLCYRPLAAQGRMDIMHGIPVRGYGSPDGNSSSRSGNMAAVTVAGSEEAPPDEPQWPYVPKGYTMRITPSRRPLTAEEIAEHNAHVEQLQRAGAISSTITPAVEGTWVDWTAAGGAVTQLVREDTDSSSSAGTQSLPALGGSTDSEIMAAPEERLCIDFREVNSNTVIAPEEGGRDVPAGSSSSSSNAGIDEISPHGEAVAAWQEQQAPHQGRRARRRHRRGRKGRRQQQQDEDSSAPSVDEPNHECTGFSWSKLAGKLLPAVSWVTLQLLLLVLGAFHFLLDLPLREYPSKIFQGMIDLAGAAVRPAAQQQEHHDAYAMAERLPARNNRHARKRRQRRRNRGPNPGRPATAAKAAAPVKVSMVATVRHSGKVISARTMLMCILCFFSCVCSTATMRVSSTLGSAATGSAVQPGYIPLPDGIPPHLHMHLLQQELANLHVSRFRSCSRP
jgi:hypothetical protein